MPKGEAPVAETGRGGRARGRGRDGSALFLQLQQLSRTWASWGGSPGLLEDSVWKKDVNLSHTHLRTAQLSLRIIKAVHALHDLKGEEQKASVEFCLKKRDMLPPFLTQALDKTR